MAYQRPALGAFIGRLAVVLCLAAGLLACGSDTSVSDDGSAPRTIVVAQSVDIQSINEVIARTTTLHTAVHYFMLFLPLLEEQADYQEGPSSWKPRLATGYRFSEDRKQLTFMLRSDARWTDGAPITAEDVRFTWQAQTHPDVAWSSSWAKDAIVDVEVVDPHTVTFHYDEPYSMQIIDAVTGVILPKHKWGELPFSEWRGNHAWFLENLVTSGPFTLERWEPQERIVLRRNETYFAEEMPGFDRLIFEIVPEASAQLSMLRAGRANVMELPARMAAEVEAAPELDLIPYNYRQYVFLIWNTGRPQFTDPRVRRALAMAIDRQGIIDAFCYGYAVPAVSPYTVDSWVYNRDLEPLPYDPDAARALLAEAGWTDSDGDGVLDKDGAPFRFELATNSDNQLRVDITVRIQDQLKQLGIEVDLMAMEFNALLEREASHAFDASLMGLGIDTSFDLTESFHTDSSDGGLNWGSYSNPVVDGLLGAIREQRDPRAAKPLYDQLQAQLQHDQPVTVLYQPIRLLATRGVEDVEPNALSVFSNVHAWQLAD